VGREWIGSGRRQSDRQSTGEQSHVDDTGPLMYGFSYALATALKNGLIDGVLVLLIVVGRECIESGRCQIYRQSTGDQSHIDDAGPQRYEPARKTRKQNGNHFRIAIDGRLRAIVTSTMV
jgi:hypothetical protein